MIKDTVMSSDCTHNVQIKKCLQFCDLLRLVVQTVSEKKSN